MHVNGTKWNDVLNDAKKIRPEYDGCSERQGRRDTRGRDERSGVDVN